MYRLIYITSHTQGGEGKREEGKRERGQEGKREGKGARRQYRKPIVPNESAAAAAFHATIHAKSVGIEKTLTLNTTS